MCRPAGKTATLGLHTPGTASGEDPWERPGAAQQRQGLCVSHEGSPKPLEGHDWSPQEPLTNQPDFQLGNWADHHWLSPLVVTISSPPSLATAIRVVLVPEQAFTCLCCYVRVARCHLFQPLQAGLGISTGVPESSLFRGAPSLQGQKSRCQQRCPKHAKEEAVCLPATC